MAARIDLAHCTFSFMEQKKFFRPNWCSPEGTHHCQYCVFILFLWIVLLHRYEDQNRKASDMYSFAILLWELATMQVPFGDTPVMAVGLKVSVIHLTLSRLYKLLYADCQGTFEASHTTRNQPSLQSHHWDLLECRCFKETKVWKHCTHTWPNAVIKS